MGFIRLMAEKDLRSLADISVRDFRCFAHARDSHIGLHSDLLGYEPYARQADARMPRAPMGANRDFLYTCVESLLIGLLYLIPFSGAQAQVGPGVILGGVFLDENLNGDWDGEEPPLEGIAVTLGDGSLEFEVISAADGDFMVEVQCGEWMGILTPPEGYLPTNDTTRRVTLCGDGVLEAVMNFGLVGTAGMESDTAVADDEGMLRSAPQSPSDDLGGADLIPQDPGAPEDEIVASQAGQSNSNRPLLQHCLQPIALIGTVALLFSLGASRIWIGRR